MKGGGLLENGIEGPDSRVVAWLVKKGEAQPGDGVGGRFGFEGDRLAGQCLREGWRSYLG